MTKYALHRGVKLDAHLIESLEHLLRFQSIPSNPVGAGLIKHNDKLTVSQHSAGRMALQEIVHVLRNARTKSAILSDTLPEREQEVGAVLMQEQ
jgi:hypothetical protein